MGAEYGTDHYLVVAKVRERPAASKQTINKQRENLIWRRSISRK
jgi:hypothetical protein